MTITYEEYEGILSYEDKIKLGDLGNFWVWYKCLSPCFGEGFTGIYVCQHSSVDEYL